ncbi:MAG: hypothetical protein M0R03_22750 [Novosphingobium sp.]|nr:hypothetical protein [Novosphingobium sp.]
MKNQNAKIVKRIVSKFSELNGTSFVGIPEYTSGTSNKKCIVPEVANHVINAGFSYGNAVEKDLKALKGATEKDVEAIAKEGFTPELVKIAIAKLTQSFENNQNKETASAGSLAQQDAYIQITPSVKLHVETGKLHIYGLTVQKKVIVKGVYQPTNSRELTLCQNEVKKYFDFSTSKFRQYIVDENTLTGVKIKGESFELV